MKPVPIPIGPVIARLTRTPNVAVELRKNGDDNYMLWFCSHGQVAISIGLISREAISTFAQAIEAELLESQT